MASIANIKTMAELYESWIEQWNDSAKHWDEMVKFYKKSGDVFNMEYCAEHRKMCRLEANKYKRALKRCKG